MNYSLQNLNNIGKLKNLTFQALVEKLNLIGLEVDNVFYEKFLTNLSSENIQLLLKIPANREDLLNEVFFLKELSFIFIFDLFQIWEKNKINYHFLLKKKYKQYINYSTIVIKAEEKNIFTYLIRVENVKITNSPLWLVQKLQSFNLKSKDLLSDIFTLVFSEWGQNINVLGFNPASFPDLDNFSITSLTNSIKFNISNKHSLILPSKTIILSSVEQNKILSFIGNKNLTFDETFLNKNNNSFILEGTFYDIHTNVLALNTLNNKISLKYLRQSLLSTLKSGFQRLLTLLEILTYCTISNKNYRTKDENINLESLKILKVKKENFINFLKIYTPDPVIFKKASLELVCETKNEYFFKIPLYRHDLLRQIDIIEEYSRFVGYKNFNQILPLKSLAYRKSLFRKKSLIKNFFLNYGFNEVITNPINDYLNKNELSILINNPLNNDFSTVRRSLIPKLLTVGQLNSRTSTSKVSFFEIGRTFKRVFGKIFEEDKLAGIFQISTTKNELTDWFKAKGFIETFFSSFGYHNLEIQKVKKSISYFHPTRSIIFKKNNIILGVFGELNPILLKEEYSHVHNSIYLFELNMSYFNEWQMEAKINSFKEYSKYPSIIKDLSLTTTKDINFNFLKTFIFSKSIYLKQVTIFDVYFDSSLSQKVNIGIRLEFKSNNETLKNDFIENEFEKIKFLVLEKFVFLSKI